MGDCNFVSMRIAWAILASLSLGFLPCSSAAQPAPMGEEFLVNMGTTGEQTNPAIATDAAGNFLIVWESAEQPASLGVSVQGRRYTSSGAPIGTEFQINTAYLPAGSQPDVAMNADGSFLVVWRNSDRRHTPRISGRSYDAQAAPAGSEFFVDDNGEPASSGASYGDYRSEPAVAAGPAGFVVVWSGGIQRLQFFGFVSYMTIRSQRFDTSGARSGTEFEAGGSGRYWTTRPDVAVNAAGGFVVVWAESSYDYGYSYYGGYTRLRTFHANGRAFDSQGARLGFFSNGSDGFNGYRGTAVATTKAEEFIVSWDTSFEYRRDVRARRYDGSGTAIDSEFIVSARPGSPRVGVPFAGRFGLDLSANDSGQFSVVWTESSSTDYGNSDGSSTGVFARSYTADGTELGAPIQVNSYTTSRQSLPAVAAIGDDQLVMTWRSYSQDGDANAVIARRFARTPKCGDATSDGQTTASDGLLALRAAVGAGSCALCICDADGSGRILATDAFLILEVAIGKQITLTCELC